MLDPDCSITFQASFPVTPLRCLSHINALRRINGRTQTSARCFLDNATTICSERRAEEYLRFHTERGLRESASPPAGPPGEGVMSAPPLVPD